MTLRDSDTIDWTKGIDLAQPNIVGAGAVEPRSDGLAARNNRHDNRVEVSRSGILTMPAATGSSLIVWDRFESGNPDLWTPSDPTAITLSASGVWIIGAEFPMMPGRLGVSFFLNGASVQSIADEGGVWTVGAFSPAESTARSYLGLFTAGSRIEASVYNPVTAGGPLSLGTMRADVYPRMWAQWLQPL